MRWFTAWTTPLLFWLAAGTPVAAEQGADPRPHVLFIAVDDLRPALGCYGDRVARTPHIDRLARRGCVFERAYCQQAVCSPSRLSMLTGLRPDTIGVWDLVTHFRQLVPEAITLPQYFRAHGYHTQSVGKIFHGSGPPLKDDVSWSVEPRFDRVDRDAFTYLLPESVAGGGKKRASVEMADVDDDAYGDGQVCAAAIETLDALAGKQQPFFLAVGFRKPHLPFAAPRRYWDLYDRQAIPLPASDGYPRDAPELATRSWRELAGYTDIHDEQNLPIEKVRELRHGYYACVSYIDALVGRLIEAVDRHGLTDRTVIVLWGDHGFHLGEQGLWTKANNFELSTRVPLIVCSPGLPADVRTAGLVELVDVYPTLAELCRLPAPRGLEGMSFAGLLADPARPWKQAALSQYPRDRTKNRHAGPGDIMGYTIRTPRWRYVEWRDLGDGQILARELYDQQTDGGETRNLAGCAEQQPTIARLAAQLAAGWQAALPHAPKD